VTQASKANKAMDAYRDEIGWSQREVTVDVEIDGKTVKRRLDIADEANQVGIEHKIGYQSLNESNKYEPLRDADLNKLGWDVKWVFEGKASKPLLDELTKNGIPYEIIGN